MLFKRLTTIQSIIALIAGLGLFLVIFTPIDAYIFNWQYTGFGPKTLWDWLELLIIPLVLAVGGYIFTRADKQAELERADRQTRTEREIAEQRAQDVLLQTYLDQMAELLLEKGLRTSKLGNEVRHVAQVRTLIALRRLDLERRTILVQFLRASRLVGVDESHIIVDFQHVDLSNADLNGTPISSINLSGANLTKLVFDDLTSLSLISHGPTLKGLILGWLTLRWLTLRWLTLKERISEGRASEGRISKIVYFDRQTSLKLTFEVLWFQELVCGNLIFARQTLLGQTSPMLILLELTSGELI